MEDSAARFGLLASAIAGRPLVVASVTGRPWTDGRTLFVDNTDDPRSQVIAMSAMIGAGSLNRDVMRELGARSNLARRYLAIEGRRALAALDGVIPRSVLPDGGPLPEEVRTSSPAESLERSRGRVRIPDAPAWFGELRPKRVDVEGDGEARMPLTLQLDGRDIDDPTSDDQDSGQDGEENGGTQTRPRTNPFGENALFRALQKMFGSSYSSGQGDDGAEMRASRGRVKALRKGIVVSTDDPLPVPSSALTGPHGNVYPEWDEHKQSYRDAYCAVVEYLPGPHELAPLDRPARHEALRRELGRLGLGPRRTRKQRIGYDLDLDAAVDAQTVIASGHTPADTVYLDNLRTSRELGVLVLLDASGSGEESTADGETVFELQRRVTAALVDTLAGLGDRVASYAFRSQGRQVIFSRLKGFDEGFSSTTLHRIGGVRPGGFTRFGGAIRHATHLLLTKGGTARRLLVVISDGFPYDHGYERFYAEGDVRKALVEARASGVGVLCLNIGSSTAPDTVARIYERTEHITVSGLDELTPSILRLVHGALRTADLRRKYGADTTARFSRG